MAQRHIDNPNLSLVYGSSYRELPIIELYTPMFSQYLDIVHNVLFSALEDHTRIAAFRVDLHYPADEPLPDFAYGNKAITAFIQSVKKQIMDHRKLASEKFDRVNHTAFHYVWVREIGDTGRPHYHVYIILNAYAYDSLGDWKNVKENMAYRFFRAWSKAIGVSVEQAVGLVQFPKENAIHVVSRNDPQAIGLLYHHMSYLCKVYSKVFTQWVHCIGSSQDKGCL